MIKEFIKYRGISVSVMTWINPLNVGFAGRNLGGEERSSLGFRKAQDIIQKNGKIITIPMTHNNP
jgi:hypothetical protein